MRRTGGATVMLVLWGATHVWAAQAPDAARVRKAALATYVHGMTETIAKDEAGAAAVPVLHELLVESDFPRRDNVVAFLAYLGGSDSTPHLLASLSRGGLDRAAPSDDRAALLVPEALARIAERGDGRALHALLALTRRDPGDPALARDTTIDANLAHQAIRALGLTGAVEAQARLAEIQRSLERSAAPDAELAAVVRAAQALLTPQPPSIPSLDSALGTDFQQDPNAVIHEATLSWANHVDAGDPIGAAEASVLVHDAARILGTAIDANDVACCATLVAASSAATFGFNGDGLDIVDDQADLSAVLSFTARRVKVVRMIDFCGSPGTNIIGCSLRPGNGMVVVHFPPYDASLWAHEYGHNVGLIHRSDPLALMYPYLEGGERISQAECAAYHAPPAAAGMALVSRGSCGKDDDSLAAQFDNCPAATNEDQSDFDDDGLGDACDAGLFAADVDRSGLIDGVDLARMGRCFGASDGEPRYDRTVDLDRDGIVDGVDLSTLAGAFGKKTGP